MAYVVAVIIGVVFGGVDQYLGSNPSWPVAIAFSLMSAPWLLLPFFVGMTQRARRRAIVLGLVVTVAALVGYGLMIIGPLQYHGGRSSFDWVGLRGVMRSQMRYLVGGLVTGPLYGYLGHRWRTTRSWLALALAGGVLVLEPLTRIAGFETGAPLAFVLELVAGATLIACLLGSKIWTSRATGA